MTLVTEAPPRSPAVSAVTAALSAPFEAREVKFKPQSVKGSRALALAYVDVRVIEDRLDHVVGVEGWQDEYETLPDGSVACRLRLYLGGQWITKMDVGSPSEQPDGGDRLKAAFSDALKRAAIKFGIGRYLYRLPQLWADYDPMKKQFVGTPPLPAFALPPVAKSAPAAKPVPAAKPASPLPADGHELHRRLRDYDAKLAHQKLCQVGAVLAYVSEFGVKAGFGPEMTAWDAPAIAAAVAAVKDFEARVRKPRPAEKSAA